MSKLEAEWPARSLAHRTDSRAGVIPACLKTMRCLLNALSRRNVPG